MLFRSMADKSGEKDKRIRELEKKVRQQEKELQRKESALAEVVAILTLKKKLDLRHGIMDEDER